MPAQEAHPTTCVKALMAHALEGVEEDQASRDRGAEIEEDQRSNHKRVHTTLV